MNTRGSTRLGRRARAGADADRGGTQPPEVYRITSAADSLSDDQNRRVKRYLLQMAIRMACFIGAVFVDGVLMWILLAGAVVLPYVAVVGANAGRERREVDLDPIDYRQLPGGRGAAGGADTTGGPGAPGSPPSTRTTGAHHG